MPQAINELDVDVEAQIQEIKRLIASTTDPEKRTSLEDHLRDLEMLSVQVDQPPTESTDSTDVQLSPQPQHSIRRKSFRPASAKPRTTLVPLAEDKEIHLTAAASFHDPYAAKLHHTNPLSSSIDTADLEHHYGMMASFVSGISSSSYDLNHAPANTLSNDPCTFWITSGLFPQFLRLTLREPLRVASVDVTCRHIHQLRVTGFPTRKSTAKTEWQTQYALTEVESSQLSTFRMETKSTSAVEVVELVIESAFHDFAVLYVVRLQRVDELNS